MQVARYYLKGVHTCLSDHVPFLRVDPFCRFLLFCPEVLGLVSRIFVCFNVCCFEEV